MRTISLLVTAAVTLVIIAGCIVSDQVTTITVQPDGSADWVKFQSNIRSTEKGAKGAEELRRFVEEFDAHKDSDYVHITQSGGEVIETCWVRREEPYASLFTARFPNWTALQNFATLKNEKGEVVAQAQFTQNGNRRRLSLVVLVPKDETPTEQAKPTIQLRQEQANGISETRVVVAGGRIIASQGFTVASDHRSALLDPAKIRELVQSASDRVELFLEWELSGE
jgi:hypothetical protein